ncbi:MAG TPA: hypothetical protein VGI45_28990 [Terracidiphilus sp.]|jgi:hypothetical protein
MVALDIVVADLTVYFMEVEVTGFAAQATMYELRTQFDAAYEVCVTFARKMLTIEKCPFGELVFRNGLQNVTYASEPVI